MKGYKPQGMDMWDAWCVSNGDEVHLFHLQKKAKDSDRSDLEADSLGHAVTRDLVNWTELPPILPPNPRGTPGDLQAWTGCAFRHEGLFYLYYTMRSSGEGGKIQSIAVAASPDLYHWTKNPGNPILEPSPLYYVNKDAPLPNGTVDCRDFIVVEDPGKEGWYGFYAARTPAATVCPGTVIAVAKSHDLLHWEALPPAFAPGRFGVAEVPDVFFLNGKWYMTCLVDSRGARVALDQPGYTCGTIYAVSDQIEGPYRMGKDYLLMAAPFAQADYSLRSFSYGSERLAVCIEREPDGRTLSPVMRYFTTPEGFLRIGYSEFTKGYREQTLIDPGRPVPLSSFPVHAFSGLPGGTWRFADNRYTGRADGWQIGLFDAESRDFEMEARVTLRAGAAAGFIWGDWAFLLDAERNEALASRLPAFEQNHVRTWAVGRNIPSHMRLRIRRPRVELYVDEALVLQFCLDTRDGGGRIGLIADRADALIEHVGVYSISE